MVVDNEAFEIVARSLGIDLPIVAVDQPQNKKKLPLEIVEQYSRRIAICLAHGMPDNAHREIDRAFEAAASDEAVTTDTQIDKLFDTKISNNLAAVGIVTIGDLVATTEGHLISITNVRGGTVKVIKDVLGKHGFQLAVSRF
jgi:DNA-directed RNA polymerase alpha subunit